MRMTIKMGKNPNLATIDINIRRLFNKKSFGSLACADLATLAFLNGKIDLLIK